MSAKKQRMSKDVREANYKLFYNKLLTVLLTSDQRIGKTPAEKKEKPSKQEIAFLVRHVEKIFLSEISLLEIEPPVHIVGDTHGQFADLLDILDSLGWPPKCRYLFMGDYVDRGDKSIELICLLYLLKAQYPKDVFILRGNHETAEVNSVYGFKQDCIENYDLSMWDIFQSSFRCMPLAGLVGSRILCMHGGISPSLRFLNDIRRIPRPLDIPNEGLVCDLLWADPTPNAKHSKSCCGFVPNKVRMTSYYYCTETVTDFLSRNDLDLIVRGHELVDNGYEFSTDKKVITIFSAPNYCDHPNDAAVLCVDEELKCRIQIFKFIKKPPTKQAVADWNEVTLRI